MRNTTLFALLFLMINGLHAQVDIQFSVVNAYPDTVVLAKYFGKRVVRINSILKNSQNVFQIKDHLEPGLYTVFYKRDNTSTDERKTTFLVDENNQKFELKITNFLINNAEFVGSNDNVLLKNYQRSMDSIFTAYRKVKDEWIALEDLPSFESVAYLESLLVQTNNRLIANTNSKLLKSLVSNFNVKFPTYTGTLESKRSQRQAFYTNDFLNMLNTADKNYSSIEQSIDYFDLYSIYSADGDPKIVSDRSNALVKKLLAQNKSLGNYYLNYLFNSFPRMTAHGYDGVTIDLVNNFLNGTDNYDLPTEKIERMKATALKIKTLLPGESLPALTLQKEDKSPFSIQSINSKYTALVVWSPDCGHCKKELPILKSKFEKYKSKGITIATICSKRGNAYAECSNFMTAQNMPAEWLKLNDDSGASGYVSKLDATSYPAFYLLDENKKFIMKRKGELTDAELEKIFKNL
jgi:thiol-disulfide isomerase/thioredoxin